MHFQSRVNFDMNNEDISSNMGGNLMPFAPKTLFMGANSIVDKFSYDYEPFSIDALDLDS